VRAERHANHRLTTTSSASCSKPFSTTPFVVLQRRISSVTEANETERRTQRQSAHSHHEQSEQHSNFKAPKIFLSTACQLRRAEQKSSIAHRSLLEWRRWRRRRFLASQLDNALAASRSRSRSVSRCRKRAAKDGDEARRNGAGARVPASRRIEHGVAVDGIGGRRAARFAEVRERCELRVVKTARARARGSGRSRRAARKRTRHVGSGARSAARRPRDASCST
jgi:hypothetical protein